MVNCGKGKDVVIADRRDRLRRCEKVKRKGKAKGKGKGRGEGR